MKSDILDKITDPTKRYDFLLLFDVTDGNPNGDPDAGNLPRIDPETMEGIVTDVCLKRKIRNYVDMANQAAGKTDYDNGIFVRDSGIALNTKLQEAVRAVDAEAKADKKKTNEKGRAEMCRRFYDIRLFGGVLSTGDYNCGQVRGPMQLTFARSVDPIVPGDIAITRVAITREGESKETEIGRKAQIPYGLYVGKGFFSPMLAADTGVTADDLKLFWRAVEGMFEIDRSASRGHMELRRVDVFRHEDPLGNAPAGRLFERLKVSRKDPSKPARRYEDYVVHIQREGLPEKVSLYSLLDD
ncbi:MAG: type I-C CRISPR-associated protein Cas7/Csd2 [Candidatus Sumerlaeaceae bacterium]|nr:type I-C CRISPR-associated protein Cas7/Csd2 [Candidatus Sumerlaeaceae bacterium]